jgi:hypothetical protein
VRGVSGGADMSRAWSRLMYCVGYVAGQVVAYFRWYARHRIVALVAVVALAVVAVSGVARAGTYDQHDCQSWTNTTRSRAFGYCTTPVTWEWLEVRYRLMFAVVTTTAHAWPPTTMAVTVPGTIISTRAFQ